MKRTRQQIARKLPDRKGWNRLDRSALARLSITKPVSISYRVQGTPPHVSFVVIGNLSRVAG